MSSVPSQISDQTSQAIALLGGATAQAYSAVSLKASPVVLDVLDSDAGLPFSDLTEANARNSAESNSPSVEKLLVDPSALLVTSRPVTSNIPDELSELPSSFAQSDIQNPELISRFEDTLLDDEGGSGVQQTGFPSGTVIADESAEILSSGGLGFSLLDFIEQAVAQAETSQQEFGDTLDGRRQGEFREFLMDTVMELDSGVRALAQQNIAGTGRDLASSSIDATGVELFDPIVEPLLAIDYYAKSAELLNGLIDATAQPIGSIALPQIGPLLVDPREELSAYLA